MCVGFNLSRLQSNLVFVCSFHFRIMEGGSSRQFILPSSSTPMPDVPSGGSDIATIGPRERHREGGEGKDARGMRALEQGGTLFGRRGGGGQGEEQTKGGAGESNPKGGGTGANQARARMGRGMPLHSKGHPRRSDARGWRRGVTRQGGPAVGSCCPRGIVASLSPPPPRSPGPSLRPSPPSFSAFLSFAVVPRLLRRFLPAPLPPFPHPPHRRACSVLRLIGGPAPLSRRFGFCDATGWRLWGFPISKSLSWWTRRPIGMLRPRR